MLLAERPLGDGQRTQAVGHGAGAVAARLPGVRQILEPGHEPRVLGVQRFAETDGLAEVLLRGDGGAKNGEVEAARVFHQTFHLQRETTQRHAAAGDSELLELRGFAAGAARPNHLAKVDVGG